LPGNIMLCYHSSLLVPTGVSKSKTCVECMLYPLVLGLDIRPWCYSMRILRYYLHSSSFNIRGKKEEAESVSLYKESLALPAFL
jgi:hypothetical protein